MQKRLRVIQPKAVLCNCLSHALNLALQEASCSVRCIRDILSLGNEVANFFRESAKRTGILESVISDISTDNSGHRLHPLCPTKWVVRARALNAMLIARRDPAHNGAVGQYAAAITAACVSAANSAIPLSCDRHVGSRRIPGWNERVEPLRQKSLFWHNIWCDCGRPKNGVVADCMRRSRASYHYSIRQVKKDEDNIIRERIANALIDDPTRNFWSEVKKDS